MTALAGFCQVDGAGDRLLSEMESVLAVGDMHVERHCANGFGVVTVAPTNADQRGLIHVDETDGTVVAVTGRLLGEDKRLHEAPARYCLELYRRMGTKLADELNGSFVLAIHEPDGGQLTLITDWFSHHPLYYWTKDGLLFGTEVKALLQHTAVDRTPNPERLVEFLSLQTVLGYDTYYDDIRQAPGASIVRWNGEKPQIERYWEPSFSWEPKASVDDEAERIATAFRNAVRRNCGDYDRVGLLLSGGLDSRMTAAAADRELLCITMHSAEVPEVITARRVAKHLGYDHVFVQVSDDYPLEIVQAATAVGDGMGNFVSAQPLVLLPLVEERGIQCLLSGYALDNYLGGKWLHRRQGRLGPIGFQLPSPGRLQDEEVAEYLRNVYRTQSYERLSKVFCGHTTDTLREFLLGRMAAAVDGNRGSASHPLDLVDLTIASNFASGRYYLNAQCIGHMAAEGILAYDREMVKTFLNTHPHHRFNWRAYRRALWRLDPKLTRIPYTKTGVPIYQSEMLEFAAELWKRKIRQRNWRKLRQALDWSKGSRIDYAGSQWPPAGHGMRESPAMRALMDEMLSASRLAEMGIICHSSVRDLIDQHADGKANYETILAAWLTVEQWLRHYG